MEFRPIYSSLEPFSYLKLLENKVSSKTICEADADLIRKYISYKLASSSISAARSRTIVTILCIWRSQYLDCDFTDITDEIWLASAGLLRSAKYKQNTLIDYLSQAKGFLMWLYNEGINKSLTLPGITIVKLPQNQNITKTPDMLLSDDEVLAMLHHPQCKPGTAALIAVLYYTGMRPSEALRLCWRDLEFSNRLLKIRITDTKTGKFRYAPCSEALEYVAYWRNHYPDEIQGGAEGSNPVFVCKRFKSKNYSNFVSHQYGSMSWTAARKQVATLSNAAIGRKINLYIFRGSDITNSAVKGVPDSVNKAIHWGNQSTSMLSTYLLLKDNQIDSAILKRAGIEEKKEENNQAKAILCDKCFTMNQPGSEYCRTCGEPLTRAAIEKRLEEREIAQKQQEEKSTTEMLTDVAEVLGFTYEEFLARLMTAKSNKS